MVKTALPLQESRVQSLARELRSHKLRSVTKINKIKTGLKDGERG